MKIFQQEFNFIKLNVLINAITDLIAMKNILLDKKNNFIKNKKFGSL